MSSDTKLARGGRCRMADMGEVQGCAARAAGEAFQAAGQLAKNRAREGVFPLEPFQPAYAEHREDA